MFEARKRRARARLLNFSLRTSFPTRVRIVAFAVKNDLSVAYWLPIVLLGGFAIWAFAQGGQRVVYALLALLIVGANLLTVANGRWIVLTDRRFLVLKMNSGSVRRLLVERADPIRLGAVTRTFSGLRGRGFIYRSIGGFAPSFAVPLGVPVRARGGPGDVRRSPLVGSTMSRRRRRCRRHRARQDPLLRCPTSRGCSSAR